MKVISLLFLLLCTSVSLSQDETDLEELIEKENLKNRPISLISVKEIDIEICFNEVVSVNELYSGFSFYYDQDKLIESSEYNSGGILLFRYKYRYDDQGNLIESSKFNFDGSLGCQYKYDDQGNLMEEFLYYSDSSSIENRYKYEYDDQGNLIETVSTTMVAKLYR